MKGLPSSRRGLLWDYCRISLFCKYHHRFFSLLACSWFRVRFWAQSPDPPRDRYFSLLSTTHLWRPITCGWLSTVGLWESKECNHFSYFLSVWRSAILHSTKLLQARRENKDLYSFRVQGWNFRSKGAFWLYLHSGTMHKTSNTRGWRSPCVWLYIYLPEKSAHLLFQQTMALGFSAKRMGK